MSQKQKQNRNNRQKQDDQRKPIRNQSQKQGEKQNRKPDRSQGQRQDATPNRKPARIQEAKHDQRREQSGKQIQKADQFLNQGVTENQNQDYIIGKNPVIEALKSERDINKILIAEGSQGGQMQQVIGMAKEANVMVQFVPKKKIDQLTEGNHQGVMAQVAAYEYAEMEDLFAAAEKKK